MGWAAAGGAPSRSAAVITAAIPATARNAEVGEIRGRVIRR